MSRPLFERLPEIRQRVAAARRLVVFLDYDGTLTPIVEHPALASLAHQTRQTLRRLSTKESIRLAVVSGRALDDVQARVGILGLIYAGNHGLEVRGPGLHFLEPVAASRSPALRDLSELVVERLGSISGVEVEFKGLTTTVHFRRARPGGRRSAVRLVRETAAGHDGLFRLSAGKEALEIRPDVDWDKGSAVRWIIQSLPGNESALAIYVGDDATDEDAFRAVAEGITVKVGDSGPTAAAYRLAAPADVNRFLVWLLRESP